MARHTPGNYVPLDVNYARDIAIRKAGSNAELLFVRSLAYAKGARTSGFVSDFDLEVVAVGMRAVKAAAQKLVEVGLWVRVDEGWQIRSWDRWNCGQNAIAAGGKLGNHKRWHADRGVTDPDCDLCADRPPIAPDVAPDSPQDSPPESQGKGREGKERTTAPRASRGTRIPDDFTPSQDLIRFAADHGFSAAQAAAITAEFVDYWRGVAGAKGVKLDWDGTWRNWVRKQDPARVRVTNAPSTTGATWSEAQLTAILGPDRWRAPQPPSSVPVDDQWEWVRDQLLAHRQDRIRQAIAKQQGGVA